MANLHLGTIGWSYSFWRGNFYPDKTAPKDFLTYYASQFNTVEVDSTFYRIPNPQAVANWSKQTPEGFRFSLKFPGAITHVKMLKNCQHELDLFLERAAMLGEKLGALLLQFPPAFGVEHLPDLADFLRALPRSFRYAVEVRDNAFLGEAFYSVLRDCNVALAWVDGPFMPSVGEVTSDFLYVRWAGDRAKVKGTLGKIEVNVAESLQAWANKLKPYVEEQIEVFGYFGKYYSGYPPSDIGLLSNLLSQAL